ncbi:EAL domain-containing protein [uncultured Massilia sp.]|uniref:bifunctional diguanylate cyclase/phosphodiesterase n=1 Tax=uncultured Massilia sp. TaxID=169973 RepID=UPI0025D6256B|nr:EAL domain-containing protein [uncultured Massilia sp.]
MSRRRLPFSITPAAALTLGGGLLATAVLAGAVARLEFDKLGLAFAQAADVRAATLRHGMNEAVEVLTVTRQLFATVDPVTRSQFRDFTTPLLERNPHIRAFNLRRVVPDTERAAFEAALRQVLPGTVLHEFRDGRLVTSPRRAQYRAIEYTEPMRGNEPAFGLDVTNNREVMAATARAHASGKAATTGLLQLAQDRHPQPSFSVVMAAPATPGGLAREIAAVIGIAPLARTTLARAGLLADQGILLRFYAGATPRPSSLAWFDHDPARAGAIAAPPPRWLAGGYTGRALQTFQVGGQDWTVEALAAPRPWLADHLASTLLLACGTLSTLLLAAFVQAAGARARKVQQLVRERTADLKLTNQRLIDDVLARQRTEKALQESEQRFRQLVAMSSDWYWEQDEQFRFVAVTGDFTEKSGVGVQRVLGKRRWEYVPALADSELGREHRATLEAHAPFRNLEYRAIDDDGEERWFCINGQPVFDEHGRFTGYRGTGSDITARKMTEQRVHHVAQHDVLTGLPNRSLLQDRLGQAVAWANRSGQQVWVMLIDLDRFKFVNDSMGHKAGDVLLMTVAARLRAALRDSDTVARLSGDEFVVILSEHRDEPLSADIVQRLMDSVAQPVMLGTKEFFVTCSIGVAVYPSDGTPAETLIEHADIAMYCAKKLGRNNFQFYTPAMNEESLERVRIEGALRNALERNEFVLHYQPQVDLKTGHIVGMEALIRWRHPELGMVPPTRFVSVAEDTGLIVQIGAWVMRAACAQNKAWQDAGLGRLRVAVNLSARQFGAPDLLHSIESVLADTGLDPACLELELTESLFMSDVTPAVELLHRMKSLGVNLSIDDFGTGYSSFSYLSRFPIDVLKIDRSFVNDITHDANDAAIVASIIALAHNLRLSVIAEGVETAEQLDYLRHQGCDEMQGYYFSRPLPAHEFEQLLRQRRGLANLESEAAVA